MIVKLVSPYPRPLSRGLSHNRIAPFRKEFLWQGGKDRYFHKLNERRGCPRRFLASFDLLLSR